MPFFTHTGPAPPDDLDHHLLPTPGAHPIAILAALRAYAAGPDPVPEVVATLDAAFHAALPRVRPTGGRILLAVDVSSSMAWGDVAGVPGLTPRDITAAMALLIAATESRPAILAFSTGGWFRDRGRHRYAGIPDGLTRLDVAPRARLTDAVHAVDRLPFGATDCALPMLYALALERRVDTFVVLTDDETWFGDVHPVQALRAYRAATGIDARLVVVGLRSDGFAIADPADPGMLDIAGFDAGTPARIADFAGRNR
jgi:60 kDa SS-A/Ro ribonucleoprotein